MNRKIKTFWGQDKTLGICPREKSRIVSSWGEWTGVVRATPVHFPSPLWAQKEEVQD